MSASVLPAFCKRGARGLLQHAYGQLEDGLSVHVKQRRAEYVAAGDVARHAKDAHVLAVGMQVAGQNAWLVAGLEHHGTGAVAEQHAGGAVVEVEDARKDFRADDQRALGAAGRIMASATVSA